MKYFLPSTLTVLCVLSTPLQALAEVQGEASESATELSTREPQFLSVDPSGIVDEAYQIQVPDWLSALAASFLRAGANVNARDSEDNAAGLLWPPRRRPIRRIRRPVYIRPRPRPRRRPPPRRPSKNINVNGANGGTNIGGNGANGGNIRVARDIHLETEGESGGGGRKYGGGGGRRKYGGGGGRRKYGGGGRRKYGGGGSRGGGRRYGGGGGGGVAGPAKANVNIKGALGGTKNGDNGGNGGGVQKVEA